MGRFPQRDGSGGRPLSPRSPASASAWEAQAGWYDARQGAEGDDFHRDLVIPAVLRQLRVQPGQTILDCCCGNGVFGRHCSGLGVSTVGVDASPSLLDAACGRASEHEEYILGDAHRLPDLVDAGRCDHGVLILALQDLDPIDDVLRGCAHAIRPGGRLVIVLTHPCFRLPKHHHWGWDDEQGVMYRRLDAYALPRRLPIKTFPGQQGSTASTYSYHRPLALYINALGAAGWGLTGCEELCSHRRGSQGRKSQAEDAAHREFPVFMVLSASRLPDGG